MDVRDNKSNKRIFKELQNISNNNNTVLKNKKIKLQDKDGGGNKSENYSLKQYQELFAKTIDIFLIIHPEAENILQCLTDEHFAMCFNLDKIMVRCLLLELHQRTFYRPELDDIPLGIPFDLSVLVTLSYMVHGNMEFVAKLDYFANFSSHAFRRCIQRVCQLIVYFLTPNYVSFPCSSKDQQENKMGFLKKFGVPGVVGVIDCFHVCLSDIPPQETHMYLNRRFQESLSVQLICDQNYRFLDVNPRFSGSTHQLHIWRSSHIHRILEHAQEKEPKTWLVADRGYHLTTVIMNPYRNAIHKQQKDVNEALKEVHEVLPKAFGILKARFRCLNTSLPFKHNHSSNIITACVTLHNYLIAKHQDIDTELTYDLPKKNKLPNARFEDQYSEIAKDNREFIKHFILNNSI